MGILDMILVLLVVRLLHLISCFRDDTVSFCVPHLCGCVGVKVMSCWSPCWWPGIYLFHMVETPGVCFLYCHISMDLNPFMSYCLIYGIKKEFHLKTGRAVKPQCGKNYIITDYQSNCHRKNINIGLPHLDIKTLKFKNNLCGFITKNGTFCWKFEVAFTNFAREYYDFYLLQLSKFHKGKLNNNERVQNLD